MSRMTRVGLLAGATALTVTGVSVASPAVEGMNEADRIQQLEARIAELEGRNSDAWLTEQRADEIRGIVHDVLADADTRASLLGSGMTSGYDDGFTIGSSDGNFLLRINGQLQTRWVYNYQSNGGAVNGDRHRSGFENTRTKLWFSGHIVNPQWGYMVETDFNRSGTANLLDAYISYDYGNGLTVRAGQMKLPFMAENLIDSRYQQAIERSLVSNFFGGGGRAGRSQGITFAYQQDAFRLTGMWSDGGFGSGGPNSVWSTRDTEWALTGRVDVLASGNWDQFNEFRSLPGEETGILIGGAFHWQETEYGTAPTEIETIAFTGDVNAKFGGFNLFGSLVWASRDFNTGSDIDQWGFNVQGGYHFSEEWEGFLRYEWADFDTVGVDDLSILTGGVNYYFAGHQAKASLDVGYSFESVPGVLASGGAVSNDMAGWHADSNNDDGQVVVRTQLQLAF